MNGGGQTGATSAQAAAGLQNWQDTVGKGVDQSGLSQAIQAGSGGTQGGDTYAFKLPDDIQSAIANDTSSPTAGLTGTQSGMTMPNFSNAMGGDGNYSFGMPGTQTGGGGGGGLEGAIAAGGKIKSFLDNTGQQKIQGGSGRVTPGRAQTFGAPVVALPMATGSNAGQSLLSLMQSYQPGVTPSKLNAVMPGSR